MKLVTEEVKIHLNRLFERADFDPANLFIMQATLKKELKGVYCGLDNADKYNHEYLVTGDKDWKKLNIRTKTHGTLVRWITSKNTIPFRTIRCNHHRKNKKW